VSFALRRLVINSLADAEFELARIGADPAGIRMMAPKMLTCCVHLKDVECRQANILKQEMLALGGDTAVARGTVSCSIEKTDLILIGTIKQLHRLCNKLLPQPFKLPELAAKLKTFLISIDKKPESWSTSRRVFSLSRPLIMGILNVTPDSFSDGNRYLKPEEAVDRALEMIDEGADIIDVGGETTKPGALYISAEEETRRVVPVIREVAKKVSCAISIDTWKSEVADAAISAGAEIINDISGFTFDPAMPDLAAHSGVAAVLMHTRGTPARMQYDTHYDDLLFEVIQGLSNSVCIAQKAGVTMDRIAIDPGIGFAKDAAGNMELLRRLQEFSRFELPLLVGTSRKSFIGKTLGREINDRLFGTAATVAIAVTNGANIIRVHDVAAMRDAAYMAHAISVNG
jgi:dihydropteroate synthase